MLNRIFHSERQIYTHQKNIFEGWYFRHSGSYDFSVIAGQSSGKNDPHAFIQYIDKHTSHYFRFDKSELEFLNDGMSIKIKNNELSLNGLDLDLSDSSFCLRIKVDYSNLELFKKTAYSPSVMGPFSYLPLSCNHAVISMSHTVSGTVEVNGERFYADGNGYIEKDFGRSFPDNYVWMHADGKNAKIMVAVAWKLIFGIRGYLCVVQSKNKQYNLSKYTPAKLEKFSAIPDRTELLLRRGNSSLSLSSSLGKYAQTLAAPTLNGDMSVKVLESLAATFEGNLVLNGEAVDLSDIKKCALEIQLKDCNFGIDFS